MSHTAYTAADIAARLGVDVGWVYAHWRDQVARHGFPPPIPLAPGRGTGRRPRLKWERAAVEAWFALQRPAHLTAALGQPLPAPANDTGPRPARLDDWLASGLI